VEQFKTDKIVKSLCGPTKGELIYPQWLYETLYDITPDEYNYFHYREPFQHEMLSLLGIDDSKIINAFEYEIDGPVDEVPCARIVHNRQKDYQDDLLNRVTWLREKFSEYMPNTVQDKKIYVTRRESKGKMVVNEEEMVEFVTSKGFTVLNFRDVPIAEQIALYNTADTILSPNGFGLANIVFCQPATKVICLYSKMMYESQYMDLLYRNIALWMGYLLAELQCKTVENPFSEHPVHQNMEVDFNQLGKVL